MDNIFLTYVDERDGLFDFCRLICNHKNLFKNVVQISSIFMKIYTHTEAKRD